MIPTLCERGVLMAVIKIAAIGMTGMVLFVMLKHTRPEYSMLISLGTMVIILYFAVIRLDGIYKNIEKIFDLSGIDTVYLTVLMKMAGITYITEIASGICRDGGCTSVAMQVELFGKISVMAVGLNIIISLMDYIFAWM